MIIKSMRGPARTAPRALASAGAFLALASLGSGAGATPRVLPFTYPYETLAADAAELEQFVDAQPLRVLDDEGKRAWDLGYRLQTELEYGITDRLELGLYLVHQAEPGGPLTFDGTRQRLRLRLAEQGAWPVDVALYGEVSELHDELELEEKVIVQKRVGRFTALTNLWVEQSFERYAGEPALFANPTLGVSYEVSPRLHLGVEGWMRAPIGDEAKAEAGDETHSFVGPAIALGLGRLFWTNAVYARLDGRARAIEPGDAYGHVWVRSVVGLEL